jgi:hypothetical protein
MPRDGRVHKTSPYEPEDTLKGIPNEVRRDRERLRRMLHAREVDEMGLPDWMAHAQMDHAREDGTVYFPAPRTDEGPGLDYLGRPTRRRRRVN